MVQSVAVARPDQSMIQSKVGALEATETTEHGNHCLREMRGSLKTGSGRPPPYLRRMVLEGALSP